MAATGISCPNCKFLNRPGHPRCLMCKEPLPEAPPAPAPAPAKPATPRPVEPSGPPPTSRGAAPPASSRGRQEPLTAPSGGREAIRVVRRMVGPSRSGGRPRPPAGAPPIERKPVFGGAAERKEPPPRSAAEEGGASRPIPPDPSKIVAWLCCDPLPPLPLGPEQLLVIGRSEPAQLVLPHREVSRRHALIKVRGKLLVLEDEGSSNGVYVNGQRVSSSVLKVGDKLTIGPYELDIRSNEEMAAVPPDGSTPTNLALTSLQRIQPGAAMTGRLDEVAASELLQQLEFNKKSGTLTIHLSGGLGGELVVKQGRPVRAKLGEELDNEAVIQIALLRSGRFTFSARVEEGEARMQTTLTGLLLEASRRQDEGVPPSELALSALQEEMAEEEPTVSFRPNDEDEGDDEVADGGDANDAHDADDAGSPPDEEAETVAAQRAPEAGESSGEMPIGGMASSSGELSALPAEAPADGEERQDLPEVGNEMDNKDWQSFWGA